MPPLPERVAMVGCPVATRSASMARVGTILPETSTTAGTRRTTPSRSALKVTQSDALGGFLEHRHAAHQIGELEQVGPRVAVDLGDRHGRRAARPLPAREAACLPAGPEPRDGAVSPRPSPRRCRVARAGSATIAGFMPSTVAANSAGENRSGSAKITSNAITAAPISARRSIRSGEHGARPGPLADLLETSFVDVDDDHGRRAQRLARLDPHILVKDFETGGFDQRRIPGVQPEQQEDQDAAGSAGRPVEAPGPRTVACPAVPPTWRAKSFEPTPRSPRAPAASLRARADSAESRRVRVILRTRPLRDRPRLEKPDRLLAPAVPTSRTWLGPAQAPPHTRLRPGTGRRYRLTQRNNHLRA